MTKMLGEFNDRGWIEVLRNINSRDLIRSYIIQRSTQIIKVTPHAFCINKGRLYI